MFVALWDQYLQELSDEGFTELASEENLRVYRKCFEDYTRGSLWGRAYFWCPDEHPDHPEGVLMWGETWTVGELEHQYAGSASFWGNYTTPEYRRRYAAVQLRDTMVAELKDSPFTGLIFEIPVGMKGAVACIDYSTWGARPVATRWWFDTR